MNLKSKERIESIKAKNPTLAKELEKKMQALEKGKTILKHETEGATTV